MAVVARGVVRKLADKERSDMRAVVCRRRLAHWRALRQPATSSGSYCRSGSRCGNGAAWGQ
eukprot:5710615-Pyramimonas_sp.AAC.1